MSYPRTISYLGPSDAICPITLIPVDELQWPVALNNNASQPYECKALVKWILRAARDPLTNLPLADHRLSELVTPLDICTDPAAVTAFIESKMRRGIWKDGCMLTYSLYIIGSVLYFNLKPEDITTQCIFLDATINLAAENSFCGYYLLAWCLSTCCAFGVHFYFHWQEDLRDKAIQMLAIKIFAQTIMCMRSDPPTIPLTVSCCVYVVWLLEYLNYKFCRWSQLWSYNGWRH